MKTINIKQVDAFTDRAFGGNPAGVVIDAETLSDAEMQSIANEMNLSETAYVLPSDKADLRIRWFTTEKEVIFCGHATVATMHVLAEEGLFGMQQPGEYSFKIETLAGILPVTVIKQEKIEVLLDSPSINLVIEDLNLTSLSQALGIDPSSLLPESKPAREKLIDYIFLGLKSLEVLKQVQYNYAALKQFGEQNQIKGFVIFSLETFDADSHVHSRFFSPYYDVIEDPVTGSANGPLAVYLMNNNLIDAALTEIKAEQGDIISRPGRLIVELNKDQVGNYQTKLRGQAVTVMDAKLFF